MSVEPDGVLPDIILCTKVPAGRVALQFNEPVKLSRLAITLSAVATKVLLSCKIHMICVSDI
jgi:hypothetical protein